MRAWLVFGLMCSASILTSPAYAWWDEGHMQIAAVAYDQLTPKVRAKVDALIRLSPEYDNWVARRQRKRRRNMPSFALRPGRTTSKPPTSAIRIPGLATGPQAGRNIGYYDNLTHKYWHFDDIGFSTDGTPLEDADPVNALSEIKLLTQGLSPSSGLPDEVRSYDLVWLIHLVGDAHQPLHATTRFSHDDPHGDQGGNLVKVVPATGQTIALHAYWDGLLGSYSTPQGAIADAMTDKDLRLPAADPALASEPNPDDWFRESEKLAEDVAYAGPLHDCTKTCELDRQYETNARNTARTQAALAAARLANLLNATLGD